MEVRARRCCGTFSAERCEEGAKKVPRLCASFLLARLWAACCKQILVPLSSSSSSSSVADSKVCVVRGPFPLDLVFPDNAAQAAEDRLAWQEESSDGWQERHDTAGTTQARQAGNTGRAGAEADHTARLISIIFISILEDQEKPLLIPALIPAGDVNRQTLGAARTTK
ncbi:hypothetical protein HYQ45_002562 [Verticillium longisporum]|uniref:Uncharacterized protein n=1 Tax=Verticillium longisporum TaxID=100787 RepID=A0A8I3AVG0_VERLO|nr:hypothetical protein HYQ45_002562 [Verticillium longisporum]